VDVGSRLDLLGFLSVICRVTFIDIRPLTDPVENLESRQGSILELRTPIIPSVRSPAFTWPNISGWGGTGTRWILRGRGRRAQSLPGPRPGGQSLLLAPRGETPALFQRPSHPHAGSDTGVISVADLGGTVRASTMRTGFVRRSIPRCCGNSD